MKFKIDENLPVEVGDVLRNAEHDALMIHDQGMVGSSDPQVASVCQSEKRAILTLESHRSVSASIRQRGSLFGQEPVGSGVFLQERVGNRLLFCLELRIQMGDKTSSLVHVCDDDGRLWVHEKVPGQRAALTRIDVERVEGK